MLSKNKGISIHFDEGRLKKRNRALSLLQNMSDFFSSSIDMEVILKGALSLVLQDFDLEAGRIYLMEPDGRHLYLAAHQGIETAGLERMDLDEGFSGQAALTRSFIARYVSDLEDKSRAALLKRKGLHIIICVPLITMNRVAGVMNLATGRPIRLDRDHVDLLNVLGNRIATAIENARLYNDLREQLQNLDEKKETIKFFAYSLAHDLKSPAIGIHGFSRLLKEKCGGDLGEKGEKYCDEIIRLAEHMVMMLEDINTYIATKEVQPHFEGVRLKEITRAVKSEFAARLKSRDIQFHEPDLDPEIVADKKALIRMFSNLVDNALKYGGRYMNKICIDYSQDEAFHILSVSDNGVGIAPKDGEKIFDAFQRNHTSQGTMGCGLGLAIVKEVAKKHGGRSWAESNRARGIRFSISIAKDLNVSEPHATLPEDKMAPPGSIRGSMRSPEDFLAGSTFLQIKGDGKEARHVAINQQWYGRRRRSSEAVSSSLPGPMSDKRGHSADKRPDLPPSGRS